MLNTIAQELAAVPDVRSRAAQQRVFNAIADRLCSNIQATGGLAIKTGGSALAKTVNTVYYVANGIYGALAAADMPALTGLTITANKFNVAVFYVDSAGTTTVGFGTEGATAAAVKFPTPPQGKATIGYLMITHSATFTGGTTALDTATTVYVNTVGPFDPSITL